MKILLLGSGGREHALAWKMAQSSILDELFIARIIFGSCCLSMIISIMFFIREIHISTNALKLHMSDMDVDVN